jgi:hypothetical protein
LTALKRDDHFVTDSRRGEQDLSRHQTRGRTRALQQVLSARLFAWDPIGVSDLPEAVGEYDCLIDPLMRWLQDGASADVIATWLCQELEDQFGLDPDPEREAALATELVDWWKATSRP